jgi:hypothetical protein
MTTAINPNAVVQPQVANHNGFISSFEHVELADGLVLRPMTDRLLVAQLDRTDLSASQPISLSWSPRVNSRNPNASRICARWYSILRPYRR